MLTGVPIQGILFTVFQSIFQVFLLCLAGFVLSSKDIVDKSTSKDLNHLNVALFTPALLFSKVAFFLSPAKLRQLWIIPIFFIVLTCLSAIVAHCLARAFRLSRPQVNFATAASMFMNSNSLPVALMQSLATTVPFLKWGPDDTVDAMFGRSLTYLVVFSTLGMILRWSYGVRLLAQADEPASHIPVTSTYRDNDTDEHCPAPVDQTVDARLIEHDPEPDVDSHDRSAWHTHNLHSHVSHPSPLLRRHTQPFTHPHSHLPVVPTSLGDQSESGESDGVEATEGESEATIVLPSGLDAGFSAEVGVPVRAPQSEATEADPHPVPRWDKRHPPPFLAFLTRLLSVLASLSPPLVASLLALFVVLVPPLQRLLTSTEMTPFRGALDNAGACSIPLTLIVLGGWFWDGETKPKSIQGGHAQEGNARGMSNGQGTDKTKGKAVEEPPDRDSAVPTLLAERPVHPRASSTSHVAVPPWCQEPSRNSSNASLSSIIGAFGDVLMTHIYPRSGSVRARQHARGDVGSNDNDVEEGLATHTETSNECVENGRGRSSRSRSQIDLVNGRVRQRPNPATPIAPLQTPNSSHTRGTNPPGETLTVVVSLLARMVIVPLIVTPMMILVSRLGWGGEVFEDPVFVVSSMLLVASPPALTLAQISQRTKTSTSAKADTFSPFERLLSRTVFWAYLVLTPPIMIASVMIGLLLVEA